MTYQYKVGAITLRGLLSGLLLTVHTLCRLLDVTKNFNSEKVLSDSCWFFPENEESFICKPVFNLSSDVCCIIKENCKVWLYYDTLQK